MAVFGSQERFSVGRKKKERGRDGREFTGFQIPYCRNVPRGISGHSWEAFEAGLCLDSMNLWGDFRHHKTIALDPSGCGPLFASPCWWPLHAESTITGKNSQSRNGHAGAFIFKQSASLAVRHSFLLPSEELRFWSIKKAQITWRNQTAAPNQAWPAWRSTTTQLCLSAPSFKGVALTLKS